jgi:hypothetical protein
MKNRALMLLALAGLFGFGLCNFAVAQNAVGGPKKPAVVGGPVKPVVIGGPAKPAVVAAPVKPVAPVLAANKPAPVVVPSTPQAKCVGHCDAKGIHH